MKNKIPLVHTLIKGHADDPVVINFLPTFVYLLWHIYSSINVYHYRHTTSSHDFGGTAKKCRASPFDCGGCSY